MGKARLLKALAEHGVHRWRDVLDEAGADAVAVLYV